MAILQYKPTSAGRRGGQVSDFADCTFPQENRPEKSLLKRAKKKGGRNNQGVICVRFRGGGHKRMYRIIDFKRNKDGTPATVVSVEYDPNRSARIALIQYEDGTKTYILAPDGLKAGDKVASGADLEPKVGNCLPLRKIPTGTTVHNVELQPGRGGQICRSAGCSATLTAREADWAQIDVAVRRGSSRPRRLPGDDRRDFKRRAHGHQPRQGGPQALARPQAAQPRRVDEPGRATRWAAAKAGPPAAGTRVRRPAYPAKGGKTRKKRKPSNSSIVRRRKPGPRFAPR